MPARKPCNSCRGGATDLWWYQFHELSDNCPVILPSELGQISLVHIRVQVHFVTVKRSSVNKLTPDRLFDNRTKNIIIDRGI